jgi:hypothetical protein
MFSSRAIVPPLFALAAVVCGTIAGCGPAAEKTYVSAVPAFTAHYPATWRQTSAAGESGPLMVFSPEARAGADSPRITLLVTKAEVKATLKADVQMPSISIEQSLGELENGQRGYRWFVAIPPAAVVIEAFAGPKDFARIKAVAGRMARDIQAAAAAHPDKGSKGAR